MKPWNTDAILEGIEDVEVTNAHVNRATLFAGGGGTHVLFEDVLLGAMLIACAERLLDRSEGRPEFLCAILDHKVGEHLRKWMVQRHAMIDPFDEKQMRQLREQEVECADRAERRAKAKERRAAKKAADLATARAA